MKDSSQTTSRRAAWRLGIVVAVGVVLMVGSSQALAADPSFSCHAIAGSDTGYCVYRGPVWRTYVNSAGTYLLYWDPAVRPAVQDGAAGAGIPNVNFNYAGACRHSDNPVFADKLSTHALGAQLSGREVVIQMRGTVNGYLKIDRIWVTSD